MYYKDNIDVKDAVLSFDKVLSLKANKFALTEALKWVKDEFSTKI